MPVLLEHLIRPFYEQIGAGYRATVMRGQICFVHIGYTRENLEVWRPVAQDASRTTGTAFELVPAPGDAFKRPSPLVNPRLETHEELLGVRAKRRPVIFIGAAPGPADIAPLRDGGRVHRRLAVVIPVYSLVNRLTGAAKYPPEFIERLRTLTYPDFLYLPPCPGILAVPSYARVGELQAVYQPHLDHRDARLVPDALGILQDQLDWLTTGTYEGLLELYREQLVNQG